MINKERVLSRFLEYVQIDSETAFEKEMAAKILADLKAMGIEAYEDDTMAITGSNANNIICRLEGDSSAEPILFSAHIDTVVPGKGIEPIVKDGIVSSKGNTILGGDDKSGVVAMVEALQVLKETGMKHRTVECVFSVREESGLLGAKACDYSKLQSKMAVALDSGGDVGKIINKAPGQIKVTATIKGSPAHAGIAPETGVSAIMAMSEAVSNMKLLRIDEETTANIGTFTASSPTNIVCDTATIIAEARSLDNKKLEAQGNHMKECLEKACEKFGAKLELDIATSYLSYHVPEDSAIIKLVSEKCGVLGLPVSVSPTGGGSDANVFNLNGIESVVLGTGMSKVHTTEEFITVENLENIAKLMLELAKI